MCSNITNTIPGGVRGYTTTLKRRTHVCIICLHIVLCMSICKTDLVVPTRPQQPPPQTESD